MPGQKMHGELGEDQSIQEKSYFCGSERISSLFTYCNGTPERSETTSFIVIIRIGKIPQTKFRAIILWKESREKW